MEKRTMPSYAFDRFAGKYQEQQGPAGLSSGQDMSRTRIYGRWNSSESTKFLTLKYQR
ncbi:MAG: hypothetical protein LUQ47_04040 [Methanotrichaceae archaeon]|nr:hypothetical protein [Methanotrichaceae archaeon]